MSTLQVSRPSSTAEFKVSESETPTDDLGISSLSEKSAKKVLLGTQKRLQEQFGRWVILPIMEGGATFSEVLARMAEVSKNTRKGFKGTFKVRSSSNSSFITFI